MFHNLRFQILFAVSSIMFIAATVVVTISYRHAKNTAHYFGEESIKNTLHSLELSIIDNYDYFLTSKHKYIGNLKKNLQARVLQNKHVYDLLHECTHNQDGTKPAEVCSERLIEKKIQEKRVPNQFNIETFNYFHFLENDIADDKIHIMVIDRKGNILSTDKTFNISSVGESYKCCYGESLSQNGNFIVFDDIRSKEKEEYNDSRAWKIGYFFPYNDSTIAAFIDISSYISIEKKERINEIKESVRNILLGIKVLDTGFAFVVNNKDNETIGLKGTPEKENLLRSIISYSKNSAKKTLVSLTLPASGIKQNFSIYAKYFDGFDWYLAVAIPEDAITKQANNLAKMQVGFMLPIFIICVLLAAWWIYTVTGPLKVLAKKLEKVAEHDFTSSGHSELLDGLPLSARNEIGKLAQTFAFMTDKLSVSIKQLVEKTAVNERMECELSVARDIQLGTLPTEFSFEPERKALDIHAYLIPAKEIGGDLYDFFFRVPRKITVFISLLFSVVFCF